MPTKPKPAAIAAASEPSEAGQAPAAPSPAREGKPAADPHNWTVTIPYVPPTVVEADDEADAWEKFKAKWGIVKSEHVPVITPIQGQ